MINIYKLKLTNLQQKILRLLYIKVGISLNARAIAKNLHVSQPAISKALPYLEKENCIKVVKDKESKRLSIELNRDDHFMIWLKRADNLKQIYECKLAQYLYDTFAGDTIILFGSYAFGEDTLKSDIDLAVIGSRKKSLNLEAFEEILQRPIIINYYLSFRNIDKHLRNNILNGITLKGAIEL
ncbi:TPA: MarR family transcriptional regulator [Candidatus Woesearchaeota archaeon]|nr:nucleotidyltransferase domain-containing protein [Candidatus Woesearchaeota archaeon]HIG93099.1 MarR family transcriptional regulator [Candidatus Woesearchaeota archaeon]HIH13245.1 MarR family transcriptional regulator [Candidatus Woesearchaeota archaeon]